MILVRVRRLWRSLHARVNHAGRRSTHPRCRSGSLVEQWPMNCLRSLAWSFASFQRIEAASPAAILCRPHHLIVRLDQMSRNEILRRSSASLHGIWWCSTSPQAFCAFLGGNEAYERFNFAEKSATYAPPTADDRHAITARRRISNFSSRCSIPIASLAVPRRRPQSGLLDLMPDGERGDGEV